MDGMFALLVDEVQKQSDLDFVTASERANEMLLPKKAREAASNRRVFANLLNAARKPDEGVQ